eukprot:NODE_6929_length_300_cov_560.322709_g5769_i0.p3 GENE.NODE_6929_length_300_cov_560.322709_g5769_i0~~NODE_6929_length_300_cov_560.322709_g5769_i0.p3  ORF type:complete len:80 (-),score=29.22 NODE_6929_length_300_cov_560.322709_g5769_i0:4-243(-)
MCSLWLPAVELCYIPRVHRCCGCVCARARGLGSGLLLLAGAWGRGVFPLFPELTPLFLWHSGPAGVDVLPTAPPPCPLR